MSRPGSQSAGKGIRPDHPRPEGRSLVTLAALALAGLGLLLMTVAFLWPSVARDVDVGHIDRFEPGTVTSFHIVDGRARVMGDPPRQRVQPRDGVHVVRLDDGEIQVFSWASTHLGRPVEWQPERTSYDGGHRGLFVDLGTGGMWAMDGTIVFGPPPRSLDRFPVRVTERGRVVIDLERIIEGERARRSEPDATPTPAATPPAAD